MYSDAGPQAISMEAIKAYADYEGIVREVRKEMFLYLITVLDRTWLGEMARRRRKAQKDAERKSRSRRRK